MLLMWRLEYPEWRDLYKRPHQHLGWPVTDEWFLSNTLSWCPTVGHDICPLKPSIGSSFCVFYLGKGGTSHTPRDSEVYFKHSGQAMRMDRARGGSANTADIHRDLTVCERQTMEHLLARGHRSFLPAQGFWSEYKTCFLLFRWNGPF